jgi:hypothetical protein
MTIILTIDDLLLELFPKVKGASNQLEALKEELVSYYSYSVYKPQVSFNGQTVTIIIPTQAIAKEEQEYNRVVGLASKGKYREAKQTLGECSTKCVISSDRGVISNTVFKQNRQLLEC